MLLMSNRMCVGGKWELSWSKRVAKEGEVATAVACLKGSKNQPSPVQLGQVASALTPVVTSPISDTYLYIDSALNRLDSNDSADIPS
ncbi:hypothetical protein CK203_034583 [Vitis vinifera]|uniref:Uncharacterized protein n=1 Tax=Vitis vinifera TaxID=29760 RepID=A0A438IDP9_VITVI|nr:hypothetical protein CK203_034583 [Vitis vinifera]